MFKAAGKRIGRSILRAEALSEVLCSNLYKRCIFRGKVPLSKGNISDVTLNWKLNTGGSLRMLRRLLASYEEEPMANVGMNT